MLPAERRPGAEYLAWSAVHGLAILLIDGPLRSCASEQAEILGQRQCFNGYRHLSTLIRIAERLPSPNQAAVQLALGQFAKVVFVIRIFHGASFTNNPIERGGTS